MHTYTRICKHDTQRNEHFQASCELLLEVPGKCKYKTKNMDVRYREG